MVFEVKIVTETLFYNVSNPWGSSIVDIGWERQVFQRKNSNYKNLMIF